MEYRPIKVRKTPYTFALQKSVHKEFSGSNSFIFRFVQFSWLVLIVCSILQVGLFWSPINALGVGFVALAWLLVTKVFFRLGTLRTYPLSSFIIIGFTTTQFYFPLVFTLLEGKPIIFNLELPVEVFSHSLAGLLVLMITHLLYRSFSKFTLNRQSSILVKAGFFSPPTERQLWFMGVLGLLSMFYVYFYSPSIGQGTTSGGKFIQGLIPFSYAPFFIPFSRLYGKRTASLRQVIPMLVVFTLLLFVVSLGRNSRGAFMLGFASVGFALGLGLLLGQLKINLFTFRNIVIAAVGFLFFTGPLVDLSTAMVVVRGQRNDVPRAELVALTLETYQDKEAIRLYKQAALGKEREWDEHYMDNLFLARFSNLKYNDASLVEASKLSEQDQDMLNFTMDRFWSTFPQPVLSILGLQVDKSTVISYSFGDYLHYKAGAGVSVLGGFRTGHFAGTGMAAFGYWYLFILGVCMLPVFYLYDKLVLRNFRKGFTTGKAGPPLFSFCGLLGLTAIFRFLPAESVVQPMEFLLRGCLQMLLLYFLVYHLTRLLSIFVPGIVKSHIVKRRRLSAH